MAKNTEPTKPEWSSILKETRQNLGITRRQMAKKLGCKRRLIKVWESMTDDEMTMARFATYYAIMRPGYTVGPVRVVRAPEKAECASPKQSKEDQAADIESIVHIAANLKADSVTRIRSQFGLALSKLSDEEVIRISENFGTILGLQYEAAARRARDKTAVDSKP
jgi:transcriptional regulator with XRE-family HTH domain